MKKLMLIAVVSAVSATASGQSAHTMEQVRVAGSQARIEFPAQLHNMWYDEFDKVKGTYYLSNGKGMVLSIWGNRLYARIDGMNKVALVAAAPYVFVARNLQMKITIDDPDVSTGDLHATVSLAAPLLSSTAPANEFVTLLARR